MEPTATLAVWFALAVYGLAWILNEADISRPIFEFVKKRRITTPIANLMSCYGCSGFWSGAVVWTLVNWEGWKSSPIDAAAWTLVAGFVGAAASRILNRIVDRLTS